MVCFSVIAPFSCLFLWFLLALQFQTPRKENLIGLVWVSSIRLLLAIGSVFTCYVCSLVLEVCVSFLKYTGLSILETGGQEGSPRGNSWAAMPSVPHSTSPGSPYITPAILWSPPPHLRISVVSFTSIRKNNKFSSAPQREVSDEHWEILQEP